VDKGSHKKMAYREKTGKKVSRRQFLKMGAIICIALGVGFGLTIFSPKLSFSQKTSEPINIGLLPPLSGIASLWGQDVARAGELTVEMLNEAGGVLGRQVKLIIQDDGSLPETAVPAAERLVKSYGCVLIVGNLLSNSRIAVDNQVAEPLKVVMNNFSYYEGSICGRYFFHMAALPNQQIDRMIPWMAKKYGKRFYLMGADYEWPHGSLFAARKSLESIGGEVVGEEYHPLGTTDFSSVLVRIRRANPNVLVTYAVGPDKIAFLKQFYAAGLKGKIAVVHPDLDAVLAQGLSPEEREGQYSCNTYFMGVPTKENQIFLDRLRKKYGKEAVLTNFGEGVIAAIRTWAKAVEKAGTTDPDEVVKAQEGGPGAKYGISVVSPQGKVTVVKENHHCVVQSYLAQCQADGTFKILASWPDQDPIIPEKYGGCVASKQYGCRPLKEKCPPFPSK